MKACLDLHDFSVVNNRLDLLKYLKNYFYGFRVSAFTVAKDEPCDWGPYLLREDFRKEVLSNLDWIQIIPHAFEHKGSDVQNITREGFKNYLQSVTSELIKDQLPYVEGFVAPHWRWCNAVVNVLDEMKWWGAVDRDKMMPFPKRYYQYNYLLNEPFFLDKGPLKLHGHIYGTKNDLGRCMDNILKLPRDTEWVFVTDFIEEADDTIM